jgi:hypothetical protein
VNDAWTLTNQSGTLMHHDGTGWSAVAVPTEWTLIDLWGAGQELWTITQQNGVLHYVAP